MNSKRFLKRIHICGTLWFLLCAAVLLVLSMRQAGLQWWVIFSLSGYSAVVLFFLFTIYLFAVYQGVVRNQSPVEHPLSTSVYYTFLYDLTPFIGSLTGLCAVGTGISWINIVNIMTQGALGMTFLVWIFIDPVLGLIEMTLPQSAAYREKRLAEIRLQKKLQKEKNETLLTTLIKEEQELHSQWNMLFSPYAREIAAILSSSPNDSSTQARIIELGALAWKTGKLLCMQFFHKLILTEIKNCSTCSNVDYITLYWDGIGNWRKPNEIQSLLLNNTR